MFYRWRGAHLVRGITTLRGYAFTARCVKSAYDGASQGHC
jgi:hypothetical protein